MRIFGQDSAINLLFDKILAGPNAKIKGVERQDWAQPLFADLLMVSGDTVCPQGTFGAAIVATLAGLITRRGNQSTAGGNRKTACAI